MVSNGTILLYEGIKKYPVISGGGRLVRNWLENICLLNKMGYSLNCNPMLSMRYVFRGIIDSLICRGKVNDVG